MAEASGASKQTRAMQSTPAQVISDFIISPLSFSEMLHPQVLRTEAFSARKTFAAEDRHSVDHRGMVDTSVEPYHLDYWSILTTLVITGLHLSALTESLFMCMIRAEEGLLGGDDWLS